MIRFVEGRDARDAPAIYDELYDLQRVRGASGGYYGDALAAIDIALWDVAAKQAGVPLYEALGDKRNERIPAYVSGLKSLDISTHRVECTSTRQGSGPRLSYLRQGETYVRLSIRSLVTAVLMLTSSASLATHITPGLSVDVSARITGYMGGVAEISGSHIAYGVGAPDQSEVRFDPNPFAAYDPTRFVIGSLTLFNGVIEGGTGIDGFWLELSGEIAVPEGDTSPRGIDRQSYWVWVLNTPNTDDPVSSADCVGINAAFVQKVCAYESTIQSIFNVWGSINTPFNIVDITYVSGGGFVSPDFTPPFPAPPDPSTVPEPSSVALVSIGLLGAHVLRRRLKVRIASKTPR